MGVIPRARKIFNDGFLQWLNFRGLDLDGIGEIEVIDLVTGGRLRGRRSGASADYCQ